MDHKGLADFASFYGGPDNVFENFYQQEGGSFVGKRRKHGEFSVAHRGMDTDFTDSHQQEGNYITGHKGRADFTSLYGGIDNPFADFYQQEKSNFGRGCWKHEGSSIAQEGIGHDRMDLAQEGFAVSPGEKDDVSTASSLLARGQGYRKHD